MQAVMTETEITRSKQLFNLLDGYSEDFTDSKKEAILQRANEFSVSNISIYELDNYWRSMDLQEFCDFNSIEPINVTSIDEKEINEFIKLIWESELSNQTYYLEKYAAAIETYYRRSGGTLSNMIFWSDAYYEADISEVINALNSDEDLIFKVNDEVCDKSTKLSG